MDSYSVAQGLMDVQLRLGVPVLDGVFNCYDLQQALGRCGPGTNLANSLALSAIQMATFKRSQKQTGDSVLSCKMQPPCSQA